MCLPFDMKLGSGIYRVLGCSRHKDLHVEKDRSSVIAAKIIGSFVLQSIYFTGIWCYILKKLLKNEQLF